MHVLNGRMLKIAGAIGTLDFGLVVVELIAIFIVLGQ